MELITFDDIFFEVSAKGTNGMITFEDIFFLNKKTFGLFLLRTKFSVFSSVIVTFFLLHDHWKVEYKQRSGKNVFQLSFKSKGCTVF